MKARVMVAGLATAGLLALAGCGSSPQVAAYVEAYQVSIAQVDDAARALADVSSATDDTVTSWRPTVLQLMVLNRVTEVAIESGKVSVTEKQRQDLLAQQADLATLMKQPAITGFISDYLDTAIVRSTDAGTAAANEVLLASEIRVNPLFGTWNDKHGQLVEGSSGSLSDAAPLKQG